MKLKMEWVFKFPDDPEKWTLERRAKVMLGVKDTLGNCSLYVNDDRTTVEEIFLYDVNSKSTMDRDDGAEKESNTLCIMVDI